MLEALIVGAGPAGVSCALQARRDGLDALLVGDEPTGGLLTTARRLDNLPGNLGISGPDLARRLAAELEERGATPRAARVVALSRLPGGGFRARLEDGASLEAGAVCLATGTRPRPLPAWAEAAFARWPGRLVREARALPAQLAGTRVVVVGGGEAALDGALWARDRGAEVELLARAPRLRAPAALGAEAEARGVRLRTGTEVVACAPEAGRDALGITCGDGRRVPADHLLVCIGREPRDELLPGLGDPLPPGVFLAGDVQNGRARYAALAMADGVRAALAVRDFLEVRR